MHRALPQLPYMHYCKVLHAYTCACARTQTHTHTFISLNNKLSPVQVHITEFGTRTDTLLVSYS
jgi:hypothetical protein